MKNEKDFKKQISEIAAEIAEQKDKAAPEDSQSVIEKFKKLKASLSAEFNSINTAEDFAYVVAMLPDIMPRLTKDAAKAGLRLALQVASSPEPVSKKAKGAMYDKMPIPKDMKGDIPDDLEEMSLKETYERIRKK